MHLHKWGSAEGNRGRRAFFTLSAGNGENTKGELLNGRFEGYVFSGAQHTGIGLVFDEDSSGITFSVGLAHVADVWLTLGSHSLQQVLYKKTGKGIPDLNIAKVAFHNQGIWWEIWHDKWGHSSKTPKWQDGYFKWWDWITGRQVHSKEVLEGPMEVGIPMPEGVYRATATLYKATWKRPRWPWPQERKVYDIDILSRPGPDGPYVPENSGSNEPHSDGYIPVPGKGENAWDCGPDGHFSSYGLANSIEEAIGHVVSGVLRDRRRRGATYDYSDPIT